MSHPVHSGLGKWDQNPLPTPFFLLWSSKPSSPSKKKAQRRRRRRRRSRRKRKRKTRRKRKRRRRKRRRRRRKERERDKKLSWFVGHASIIQSRLLLKVSPPALRFFDGLSSFRQAYELIESCASTFLRRRGSRKKTFSSRERNGNLKKKWAPLFLSSFSFFRPFESEKCISFFQHLSLSLCERPRPIFFSSSPHQKKKNLRVEISKTECEEKGGRGAERKEERIAPLFPTFSSTKEQKKCLEGCIETVWFFFFFRTIPSRYVGHTSAVYFLLEKSSLPVISYYVQGAGATCGPSGRMWPARQRFVIN